MKGIILAGGKGETYPATIAVNKHLHVNIQ